MKLEEAKMKLPAYLRGALTREESEAVEQALASEQPTPAELQRLAQVDGMLRAAPAPEPPAAYFKDLAARIQSKVVGMAGDLGQETPMSSKHEDSGLLDVKALAATSLSAEKDAPDEIPVSEFSQISGRASVVGMQVAPLPPPEPAQFSPTQFSPSQFSPGMAQPQFQPVQALQSPKAPKWVWPLVGLVGVTAAGAIAVAVFAMKDKPEKPAASVVAVNEPTSEAAARPKVEVTQLPANAGPAAAKVEKAGPAKPAEKAPEVAKAAPVVEPVAAAAADEAPADKGGHGKAGKGGKAAKGGKTVAAAPAPKPEAKPAPAAKPEPKAVVAAAPEKPAPAKEEKAPEKAAKPSGKHAELDSLIASALTPGKSRDDFDDDAPKKKEPPKADAAPKPTADPMKTALDGLKPRGKKCFAKFNIPGTVSVRLTVGPNGSVQTLTLSGDYEGTPTGQCLQKELKSALFPTGGTRTVNHSFKLP